MRRPTLRSSSRSGPVLRLTVLGETRFLLRDSDEGRRARSRFLARHPKSALYADFGDLSFVQVEPQRAFLNAGFGRASELGATDFTTRPALASMDNATIHSAIYAVTVERKFPNPLVRDLLLRAETLQLG